MKSLNFQSSCFQSVERSEAEASGQSLVLGHITDERQNNFMNARSKLSALFYLHFCANGRPDPQEDTTHKKTSAQQWHLTTIDMGQKEGGCYAPFREYPSSTMWPGPRSTTVLSLCLCACCKHRPLRQNQIFKLPITFYNARR